MAATVQPFQGVGVVGTTLPKLPGAQSGPPVYLLPTPVPQPTVDFWARSFAFLGVVFGFIGLMFGLWKMISDRRLSILDEFWLRKIISPAAIEPLIKTISHLLSTVPGPSSKPKHQQAFATKMTQEIQRLMGGTQTLAMLDAALPLQMQSELSKCEDLFGEYIQGLANQQAPDIAELHSAVWLAINGALKPVQTWQSKALFKFHRPPTKLKTEEAKS